MQMPSMGTRVRIDRQGRMVLPKWLRQELGADPGEVTVHRTAEGVLLTPTTPEGRVTTAPDGLPVLQVGRPVANDEVLGAIDDERAAR